MKSIPSTAHIRMDGCKFRRQIPIGSYTADFVCHEARLIVEVDGGQHDRSSCGEAERTEFMQNEGYCVLRFWNNEILANLDGIHSGIADELGCITPPCPPPSRGRVCVAATKVRRGPALAPARGVAAAEDAGRGGPPLVQWMIAAPAAAAPALRAPARQSGQRRPLLAGP